MNRSTVIALVIAGLLVFAGVFVLGYSFLANRWDLSRFGEAGYGFNTITVDQPFRGISIDSRTEDITFLPSQDGKCTVMFYEQSKLKHTAAVANGTLAIGVTDTRKWYDHLMFFTFDTPKITVYLPEADFGALSVRGSTGDIRIPEGFTFEQIDISASTGDVSCGASSSGRIRIRLSTGDIILGSLSAKELDLSVSTGRVEVAGVECEGSVSLEVSTGRAVLSAVTCGDLSSEGDTGDLTMQDVVASGTITIERSTGNVKFLNCDAASLSVETDTGDVTGTLRSPKVFLVETDTGRVHVPDTSSGGEFRIETDTGDIIFGVE